MRETIHGSRRAGDGGARSSGADVRRKILRAIEEYHRRHDHWPTYREIGTAVNIGSTSHVAHHVAMLVKQGYLTRERGISRGVTLAHREAPSAAVATPEPVRPGRLPILGRIAAGEPLDLFESGEPERLELDYDVRPSDPSSQVYALQVAGDSMIEDGILDGDYVLVQPAESARSGAIVVAVERRANGGQGAATLKRIFIADDHVRLEPANAAYTAREIAAADWNRDWMIQGIMVGLYRRFEARPLIR